MNSANALGFFAIGVAMWVLPLVAPGLFPATAVDGSSTRAIWMQLMGLVQTGLGLSYLIIYYVKATVRAQERPLSRGATATADWQGDSTPEPVLAVSFAGADSTVIPPSLASAPSAITLEGEHALLWQALHQALRADANVRRLAHRVVTLVHHNGAAAGAAARQLAGVGPQPDPFAVLPFLWSDERGRLAEEPAA